MSHMGTATVAIPEEQIVEWVTHLSPQAKREILRILLAGLDDFEARIDRGSALIREIAMQRLNKSWDALTEEEQNQLIDQLLHE